MKYRFVFPVIRLHLGKEYARFLRGNKRYFRQLGASRNSCQEGLDQCLADLGETDARERRHVLLGQSAQLGDINVFLDILKWHFFSETA